MKIACCADLHLGEFKDFSKEITVVWDFKELCFKKSEQGTSVNSRLIDAADCLVQIRRYCIENKIDTLLIAGDIFNNRASVPTIVYNIGYRVLESFMLEGINLYVIPGNHDQKDNTDYPENSLKPFSRIMHLFEKPELISFGPKEDSVEVLCIPYTKNKSIVMDAVNNYIPNPASKTHIIMTHLGVSGAFTGANSYAMMDAYVPEELRYEDVDFVVLGHYHKAQMITGTDDKMFYTGSPLQLNFNDEGEERGFWVLDTIKKETEFVLLNAPKFITVTEKNYKNISDKSKNFIKLKCSNNVNQKDLEDIVKDIGNTIAEEVKVELEKEYVAAHRSDITPDMSYKNIVEKFSKENNFSKESLDIGLDIINTVL